MPHPSSFAPARRPTVVLRKNLARALRAGHPWLFADALTIPAGLATGTAVDIADRQGRVLACGLYDADSPLAVRVWTVGRSEAIDARLVHQRVAAASALRRVVIDPRTTDAYRLLHGEGDRLPGIICDVYADTAVIQIDTPAVQPLVADLVGAILAEAEGVHRVLLLPRSRDRDRGPERSIEPELLAGPPPGGPLVIREHGLRFEVDIARGHKTGLYLDQRENRRRIRELAMGRRTLNLFAYTGGFSVAAAAGGAVATTSVDIGRPAIDAAARNFALNGLGTDAPACRLVAGDVFDFLGDCDETFELVVVDPPSMAPSKGALEAALAAYRRLNALALGRVAPGGLYFTASCSSHVTADQLRETVGEAAVDARRDIRILELGGAGPDHPTLPGFAEGRYLKTLLAYVP
jgi:23S rRNA (cytosine1962-C5)-methyltransferase